jgi:hypothetical protein
MVYPLERKKNDREHQGAKRQGKSAKRLYARIGFSVLVLAHDIGNDLL